ncbi:MAG TPA: mandelate racemase/muconate lactonizing enzyme family protein [Bryobacteraceae bacterium]|nr:mandelate racemase/muconate lactonizing enzyme family protein [Bryobacteraceae bacterium]
MLRNVALRRARLAAMGAMQGAAAAAPSDKELRVQAAQAFVVREPVSRRTYTVVRLRTFSGVTGYGECAGDQRTEVARATAVIEQPATSYQVLAGRLAEMGGVGAAINMALLDIVGKAAKAPVYQVLGGPTRFKARALAPLKGESDAALLDSMKRAASAGYRAFMVPAPPVTFRNQGQAWVLATRKRLEALRGAGGQEVDFVLDGGGRFVPGDASMAAADLEKFHLLWFDEPCPYLNLGAVKKIAGESVTPLGFGRNVRSGADFQNLLREDAIDVIRPDISLNGISEIRRMAVIAETYYVAAAPYHDGGPIATAAALHLAASLPNFFIQQIPLPEAEQDRRMRAEIAGAGLETVKDGFAALPTGPGLGVTVDEEALKKYREAA